MSIFGLSKKKKQVLYEKRIKLEKCVEALTGCPNRLQTENKDAVAVAFSGISERVDLIVWIHFLKIQNRETIQYGCFVSKIHNDFIEQEWESEDACIEAVAQRMTQFVNKTARFKVEQRRYEYRIITQMVKDDETGEWVTVDEEKRDSIADKPFWTEDIDEDEIVTFVI